MVRFLCEWTRPRVANPPPTAPFATTNNLSPSLGLCEIRALAAVVVFTTIRKSKEQRVSSVALAEGEGFEPSKALTLPVFKTGAFNRSATPPGEAGLYVSRRKTSLWEYRL